MKPPQPLLPHQCEMWFALLCISFSEHEKHTMPKRMETDIQIIKHYVHSQETTVDYDRSWHSINKKKKFSKFQISRLSQRGKTAASGQPASSLGLTLPFNYSLWTLDLNSLRWLSGYSDFLSQCLRNNIISKLVSKMNKILNLDPAASLRMPKDPVLSALV